MLMNLKMVTWEGDLTQFIVNIPPHLLADDANKEAIKKAIEANLNYDTYDEDMESDMNDPTLYIVEDVDFALLAEMFQRNDIIGLYNEVILFND